jgi:hypothetical protein
MGVKDGADGDMEEGRHLLVRAHAGGTPGPRAPRGSLVGTISRVFSVRSGTARVLLAVFVSVSWMFFSSLLILVNKHILKDLKFP